MEELTIRAFKASDEPETCVEFLREHVRVLQDFGITNVTSNNANWIRDPHTYVIVAEHHSLGMVGGARLYVSHLPDIVIPMENAVGRNDGRMRAMISRLSRNGVAEICGLWNAHRYAGRSMPHLLVMVGITLANQLSANAVLGLAAKYTLKYATRLGMTVMKEVGDQGWFEYPRPGFNGIVMGVTDPLALKNARSDLRQRIVSLRLRPQQQILEDTGTTLIEIDYQLRLRQSVIELASYGAIEQDRLRFSA